MMICYNRLLVILLPQDYNGSFPLPRIEKRQILAKGYGGQTVALSQANGYFYKTGGAVKRFMTDIYPYLKKVEIGIELHVNCAINANLIQTDDVFKC